MNSATKKKESDKQDELPKFVIARYRERLSYLRKAQEYSQKDDVPRAVENYNKYLNALARYYETDEEHLSPNLFDQKKELAELLLISQVYWDLSKAFDRNQKLKKECKHCLQQFAKFSIGYKYQYLNSELLRKFLRKKMCYNPELFEQAYQQIQVNSKQCYIATACFGQDDPTTNLYRDFKKVILQFKAGHIFVDLYYRFSPRLLIFCEKNPALGKLIIRTSRFFLFSISKYIAKIV